MSKTPRTDVVKARKVAQDLSRRFSGANLPVRAKEERWYSLEDGALDEKASHLIYGMLADLAAKDALCKEMAAALAFYANEERYAGPNQKPIKGDIYQPIGMVYRLDVCRDLGGIARRMLAKVPK